jgi:hypothetical protein
MTPRRPGQHARPSSRSAPPQRSPGSRLPIRPLVERLLHAAPGSPRRAPRSCGRRPTSTRAPPACSRRRRLGSSRAHRATQPTSPADRVLLMAAPTRTGRRKRGLDDATVALSERVGRGERRLAASARTGASSVDDVASRAEVEVVIGQRPSGISRAGGAPRRSRPPLRRRVAVPHSETRMPPREHAA